MTTNPPESLTPCAECGMPCHPGEFHPFAACLMFKACHYSEMVRANLAALQSKAAEPAGERAKDHAVAPHDVEEWRDEYDRLLGALIGLHVQKTYEIAVGNVFPRDRSTDPEIRAAYVALLVHCDPFNKSRDSMTPAQRNEVLEEVALHLEDIDPLCAEEVRAMKEKA